MQENSISATQTFLELAMVVNTLQGTAAGLQDILGNPKDAKKHVEHSRKTAFPEHGRSWNWRW